MKYRIELSEDQVTTIKIALEEYFRLRMNQTWDFADDLCFDDLNYENHTDEEFDEHIKLRDEFRDELQKLLNKFHPLQLTGSKFRKQTTEMKRAQEIWQVIRHKLWIDRNDDKNSWCVDSREPMSMTGEVLPEIERIEE